MCDTAAPSQRAVPHKSEPENRPLSAHREIAVGQGLLRRACPPVHLSSEMLTFLINSGALISDLRLARSLALPQ